jgi:hypothetical protein
MTPEAKLAALAYHAQWYDHIRELPGGLHWAGVNPQFFNVQIIRASFADPFGWEDSW